MTKYEAVDQAILSAIGAGIVTFSAITERVRPQAEPHVHGRHEVFRVVDHRLQHLKKKGVIGYERKTGWCLATVDRTVAEREKVKP